jgi:hypothetical protein
MTETTEYSESGGKVLDFPVPAAPVDAAPVDMTKAPAAAPAVPVEGVIVPALDREIGEDPEGDRPWIDPRLKTAEGRAARYAYHRRQARRRVRKLAARQRTVHGVLPRVVRGEARARRWVIGLEGAKAHSDLELAHAMTRDAKRQARSAARAIKDRKVRQAAAQGAQQQASLAVTAALAGRGRARKAVATRAGLLYGPFVAGDLVAFGLEGVWGALGALALNLGALAWTGRKVELTDEEQDQVDGIEAGIPQRVEPGMTPRMFEAMIREALTEDLKVTLSALRVDPHPWGFEVHVWLNRMTPKAISDGLDLLEACLPGVRTRSILLQQSASARNECVLRIPGSNPWLAVPELPYRAPHSVKTPQIHTAQIGADMSGRVLALPMQRTNVNMVGKSRSGKSTLLRAILDATTATEDQIVIGIDLGGAGSGFGGLRHAMHVVATTAEEAYDALSWALRIGKGRPALFDMLAMGENWVTSAKRPGVKIIVDEFPALVRESRKGYPDPDSESGRRIPWDLDVMLAEIAITSAKSDVTIVIAGQGVTKEKVGANTWVVELPVQVMGACDKDDINQIVGGGAMAEGWRPDRLLPAMGDQLNDASVAYVLAGAAYSEPIPYRGCYAPDDELTRRGKERAAAGLVDIDQQSADLSHIKLADLMAASREAVGTTAPAGPPELILTIRDVFTKAGDPAGLSKEDLADALGQVDPGRWALDQFDGGDDSLRVTTRVDALRTAITAVLAPSGQTWALEKYIKDQPRGYRLRDLKAITGESADGS